MYRFIPVVLLMAASIICGMGLAAVHAQTLLVQDGFEDGDHSANPAWEGDVSHFRVINTEPNHLLQLQGITGGGTSYLSTPLTGTTGSWEFYYRYDASSAPSGSNKASIFLMSDRADLTGEVNGYAVQVGRTGDDFFELVRFDEGQASAPILSDPTLILHNETGYRVRITRNGTGEWQLQVGAGYSGRLLGTGEAASDNIHTAGSYFGVLVQYTSTRTEQFYFDFKLDLPPFQITSADAIDERTIEVNFNREVDEQSMGPNRFSLNNGIGSPASVTTSSPENLLLHFNRDLPSGSYFLSLTDLRDRLGNPLQSEGERIIFAVPPSDTEVQINEFLYAPPGDLAEYVELSNTGGRYLDLSGWQIGDFVTAAPFGNSRIFLEPGGFLVLSGDTTALYNEFGSRNYLQLNLPALNNTGDAIRLLDADGGIADSLSYTQSWGGSGVALERRTTAAPASLKANWGAAPNGLGTPGRSNDIEPDQTPPELTGVLAVDNMTLQLKFSEPVMVSSASAPANYRLSPTRSIHTVTASEDTVFLLLADPLQTETSYSLTAEGVTDVFGNLAPPQTMLVEYREFGENAPGAIVINEIHFNGSGETAGEFIELYNGGSVSFDLSQWILGDAATTVRLPEGLILDAGGYLVLSGAPATFSADPLFVVLSNFPSLNDNGDAVFLKDRSLATVDSLHYLPDWGRHHPIASLERRDPQGASNDPANWQYSSAPEGHSAGRQNTRYQADTEPPELTFATPGPEGILEVRFSEFIIISENTRFTAAGAELAIDTIDKNNASSVLLRIPSTITERFPSSVTAENISDIPGNLQSSSQIAIAYAPTPFDLVINEIMYRPLSNPDDNRPDQSEYIELRNNRDYALSLEGLYLHDAPDEQNRTRDLYPVSSEAKWIPPQGIALVYADPEPLFEETRIAAFFDLPALAEGSSLRMDRSSLSLAASQDAVYLANRNGGVIDSVFYSESWHNPNILDTRGIALERISPKESSNDPSNWGSSIILRGGTPGQENSIYLSLKSPSPDIGLTLSPNPFSPDDDGYEDHLLISYRLEHPDYLIRAEVYDRYGRYIATLADGRPAGYEGTLIWDGRREQGERNHVGIYILLLEAYDSASGKNQAFKSTVVLARRFN